jgi:hypothetical protein
LRPLQVDQRRVMRAGNRRSASYANQSNHCWPECRGCGQRQVGSLNFDFALSTVRPGPCQPTLEAAAYLARLTRPQVTACTYRNLSGPCHIQARGCRFPPTDWCLAGSARRPSKLTPCGRLGATSTRTGANPPLNLTPASLGPRPTRNGRRRLAASRWPECQGCGLTPHR